MRVSQAGRERRKFSMLPVGDRLTYGGYPITYKQKVLSVPELFDVLTYDYNKTVDALDIGETYEQVGALTTPQREAGTYRLELTLTVNFTRTNRLLYIRFRVDGGDWNEFTTEPDDVRERIAATYFYPAEYAAGVHTIEVEMRKEDEFGTLDLLYLDIGFERVG